MVGYPNSDGHCFGWLVARAVFGAGHPAINFLLLLAVADDALGLVIIAIFYGDPALPAQPVWLLLVLVGMLVAFGLRMTGVRNWLPYIFIAGPIAWYGLILAHLHAALALVFIVPFLPARMTEKDRGHSHCKGTNIGPRVLLIAGYSFRLCQCSGLF